MSFRTFDLGGGGEKYGGLSHAPVAFHLPRHLAQRGGEHFAAMSRVNEFD
jgi:hypothetical protein